MNKQPQQTMAVHNVQRYFQQLIAQTSQIDAFDVRSLKAILNAADQANAQLQVLRLDKYDQFASGNKWFKLKYNLISAAEHGVTHIGSFGGAWSNHLHALGQICADLGLQFTAFVRGGPFANPSAMLNDLAANTNNQLVYLDYADYKKRAQHEFVQQLAAHYQCHILPEGGSTELAVQGCAHILPQHAIEQFQYFVVAAGTGATAAGLLRQLAPYPDKELIVIPVLKQGEFIAQTIHSWTMHDKVRAKLTLWLDGHFGGYAKVDAQLLNLIELSDALGLPLEPIYSGKVLQRLLQSDINLQQTLMIHTGGLQGRRGFGL